MGIYQPPLIKEVVKACPYGPVVPIVYARFKSYKGSPIDIGYIICFNLPDHATDLYMKFKTRWCFQRAMWLSHAYSEGLVKALMFHELNNQPVPYHDLDLEELSNYVLNAVKVLINAVRQMAAGLVHVGDRKAQAVVILSLPIPQTLHSAFFAKLDDKPDSLAKMVWRTLASEDVSTIMNTVQSLVMAMGQAPNTADE